MKLTLDQLFGIADFVPNENQSRAISHTDGPLFLVAGPGSGKTRVLLWRTVNLIVFHDVDPEDIFLSTFTEKAAKQLKDGLLSLLGLATNMTGQPFDISKMYIGTVHSLCQRLLTDRAFSPGRSRRDVPLVLDALDQYFTLYSNRFWTAAQANLGIADLGEFFEDVNIFFSNSASTSKHRTVQNLIILFNRFSEENLPPDALIGQATDDTMRQLAKLYRFYLEFIGTSVDLSLLQQAAFELLSQNGGAGFKHVIIDEYQDTNAIQEQLFFRLASQHKNICVVGDDDQALYRFRGATVENFVQFPERCQHYLSAQPERVELNTNYRSRREVVDFYCDFVQGIDWRRPQGGHFRLHDKNIGAHSQD